MPRVVRRRKPGTAKPRRNVLEEEAKSKEEIWVITHMGGCDGEQVSSTGSCENRQCSYRGEGEEAQERPSLLDMVENVRRTDTDAMHGAGVVEILEAKVDALEKLVLFMVVGLYDANTELRKLQSKDEDLDLEDTPF